MKLVLELLLAVERCLLLPAAFPFTVGVAAHPEAEEASLQGWCLCVRCHRVDDDDMNTSSGEGGGGEKEVFHRLQNLCTSHTPFTNFSASAATILPLLTAASTAATCACQVPSCCVLTSLGLSLLPGSVPGGREFGSALQQLLQSLQSSSLQLLGSSGFQLEAAAAGGADMCAVHQTMQKKMET